MFVHFRAVNGEGHRTLRDGQKVTFAVVDGQKGLRANKVTPV